MGRRAGIGRILYTSQLGAAHDSRFQACRDHARTEDLLRAPGLPWTALRNPARRRPRRLDRPRR
ncbi:hypothetical protein ABT353_47015, partial [Nonomuraea wenchangensis]